MRYLERLRVTLKNREILGNFLLLSFKGNFKEKPYPGNFYMLLDIHENFILPRPYSVFDFNNNEISFLVKNVGKFSNYLFSIGLNEDIFITGPCGNPVNIVDKAIFIAGGIGFAPLHYHSKFVKDFIFFFGGKTIEDIICEKFVKKIFVSTDDGTFGFKGDVVELFINKLSEIDISSRKIYACGPRDMLKKIKYFKDKINIPIYFYLEERMGCGFGGCKGCAILTDSGYKLVCKDGPVFDSNEVIFE